MPLRAAGVCGLLAPVTYLSALLFGGLVQREGFSNAEDSISDLGADTASSAWIYNQIGTNLTGFLIVLFGLGLWRALSPDWVGCLGAGLLALFGVALLLEGFLPLDCQGVDVACDNLSWQSDGHRWVSRVSSTCLLLAPLVLALAFRRSPRWRDRWLPTLLVLPAFIAASIAFSAVGEGAAARAAGAVWFLWVGLIAFRLLRLAERGGVRTAV